MRSVGCIVLLVDEHGDLRNSLSKYNVFQATGSLLRKTSTISIQNQNVGKTITGGTYVDVRESTE